MKTDLDYVAGFLFDESHLQVALIEKTKPDWQKGKLNAIGGKIEAGELPDNAMRREFLEETGLDISNWKRFCVLRGESDVNWRVHFYYAIGDLSKIRQMETEKPFIAGVDAVGRVYDQVIPNLRWLIPMAENFANNRENCSAFQVVEL